jgi:hypothetical protein
MQASRAIVYLHTQKKKHCTALPVLANYEISKFKAVEDEI